MANVFRRTDQFIIPIPADFSDSKEERGQQAIREAEAVSPTYAMVGNWEAICIGQESGHYLYQVEHSYNVELPEEEE